MLDPYFGCVGSLVGPYFTKKRVSLSKLGINEIKKMITNFSTSCVFLFTPAEDNVKCAIYVISHAIPGLRIGIADNAKCVVLHKGSRRVHIWQ